MHTDRDLAHLAALRAGYRIGGCQVGIALREPAWVHLLPKTFAVPLETWLVMHGDLRANSLVRLVFEHLAVGLVAYVAMTR